jgi:hypothetical protein
LLGDRLDDRIEVNERPVETSGEDTTDSRFAAAGRAVEEEVNRKKLLVTS